MVNADDYWERFYNPRIAVPDFQNYIDRWYDSTLKFKKNLGKSIEIEMDVPYGDSIVETMDIFKPKKSVGSIKALMLFIHGGYWRSKDLTKKEHGFVAKPFVEKGFAVAVLDYALCPEVSLPEICKQIVKAGECLYRDAREVGVSKKNLYVVGHSAGAHLAGETWASSQDTKLCSLVIRTLAKLRLSRDFYMHPLTIVDAWPR